MKIEVTEKFLLRTLERLKEMKNYGSCKELVECEKLINNIKHYLKTTEQ